MPKFDSSLGSKRVAGQPLKEFDIPDESGYEPNDMAPVMRHRGPAPHGSQPPIDLNAAIAYQQRLQASMANEQSIDESVEIEKEIRAAREAKRTGVSRLNDGAKRRVEMLVGMTRSSREVDLEGNKFVLQTLRSKEMREAIMAAAEYDGTVQSPFEIRRQLLARSLVQVANVDINHFVGSDNLDAKLQLIDDLDDPFLNRLYDEYLILVRESREKFAIKNASDAQEVVEDLKK